jgi:hypothetical protein
MKKTIALLALVLSAIALVYTAWPAFDVILTTNGVNIDIPFMTINQTGFRVYGIDLVGFQNQWSFIMLSSILTTLTGRLFYLALLQTSEAFGLLRAVHGS